MSDNPFKIKKPQELDKFQVATTRFIDTLQGHQSGNHPVTSIDNIRAVCEVMNGIANHLKKSEFLPPDFSLIYSRQNPSDDSNIKSMTDDMYKSSRHRSNFSKHADRDANKALSFDAFIDVDHFIFNMVVDYETLHCALMNNGLLDSANEKLYPVQRSMLSDKYRKIYYPQYDVPDHGKASSDPMLDLQIRLQRAIELRSKEEVCLVPAGTAACAIFTNDEHYFEPEYRTQQFKELGIWPVNTQTNARFTKDLVHRAEQNLGI